MKTKAIGAVGVGMLSFATALATAANITFANDPLGNKPNGWRSVESSVVSFADTQGANLEVNAFSFQAMGMGLAIRGDDASKLRLDFAALATTLWLDFGNDDPGYCGAGDVAVLQVFRGLTLVGQTTVELNRDDHMNQSIGLGSVTFDHALFYYGNAQLNPNELIEVVDNISFTTVIPEPTTTTLALLALGGLAWARRKPTVRLNPGNSGTGPTQESPSRALPPSPPAIHRGSCR